VSARPYHCPIMTGIGGTIGLIIDLLLVIVGFGLIIFVHELGHFLAAKWAGIRVLAFAIGFGPAILSFRKGMGLRVGSSEPEYVQLLEEAAAGDTRRGPGGISPTEYRLNYLPLGGYVKMLGQEDLNPEATSVASDSYQNCRPWKRMVVISAGVVMNVISAALLFIVVFMYGLKTEPPKIGSVVPGTPAAAAAPATTGVEPGLRAGDVILEINGRQPNSFNDLVLAAAMTRRDSTLHVKVQREELAHPVVFEIRPRESERTRLLEIGVEPARAPVIHQPRSERDRQQFSDGLAQFGLAGVEPGMRMVRVQDDTRIRGADELFQAIRRSGGQPVEVEFAGQDGRRVTINVQPQPVMQVGQLEMPSGSLVAVQHLLGLTPVMNVASANEKSQGLQTGDIFARVGAIEYPSLAAGIAEIHRHYGRQIEVSVLRRGNDGSLARVDLTPTVHRKGKGQIGFSPGETSDDSTLLALPPPVVRDARTQETYTPAATAIITRPGMRILSVAEMPVANFGEVRAALRRATAEARGQQRMVTVPLVLELPLPEQPGGMRPTQTVRWTISPERVEALHELGWTSPFWVGIFELEEFVLRAEGPLEAVQMGVAETHRVMMMTYLTFARLFQGTVKWEHLKGPVGIAHMGTRIAERGFIWLLFFMALISVNLAVINFLPLPIVDGGQFIFLVIEQIRGKPVPVQIQNVATLAGLLLIGAVFLIVTFHDIANLFG
jgi:regulator of sigma E protease